MAAQLIPKIEIRMNIKVQHKDGKDCNVNWHHNCYIKFSGQLRD